MLSLNHMALVMNNCYTQTLIHSINSFQSRNSLLIEKTRAKSRANNWKTSCSCNKSRNLRRLIKRLSNRILRRDSPRKKILNYLSARTRESTSSNSKKKNKKRNKRKKKQQQKKSLNSYWKISRVQRKPMCPRTDLNLTVFEIDYFLKKYNISICVYVCWGNMATFVHCFSRLRGEVFIKIIK